jgi:hypothetical protein
MHALISHGSSADALGVWVLSKDVQRMNAMGILIAAG